MAEIATEERPAALVPMELKQFLRVILIGAIVGVVTWGLMLLFDTYVFKEVFCHGVATMRCDTSLTYASAISSIAAAGLALFGLMRLEVYRALLVVIAATISLWGLHSLVVGWSWQLALLSFLLAYAVCYGVFAWLARVRLFLIALLLMLILVVLLRLTLNS